MTDVLTPRWMDLRYHREQQRFWKSAARYNVVPSGRRSGKCLAEGTLIYMCSGQLMTIELVKPGDLVWGINDQYELEPQKVVHVHDNGEKQCLQLKTTNSQRILCTPNHPFLVFSNWTEASEIDVGDLIAMLRMMPIFQYEENIPNTHFSPSLDNDVKWVEIAEIKDVGIRKTFDLTVEHNHNFVANGFVTHNTELAKRKIVLKALNAHRKDIPYFYKPWPDPRFFFGAPTREQAKRIYWNDLKALIPQKFIYGRPNESQLMIQLINGSQIWCLGLDRPERAEGVPWDGGVLDEFGNMRKNVWQEHIRPSLSDRLGSCDFIGVPEGRNHYYELYKEAQSRAAKALSQGMQPIYDHFHWFSSDILPPEEIEAAREDLDELTFKQEYEGCHRLATKVLMVDGTHKRIFEIKPGDAVFSYQNGELVPCNVMDSGYTGEKPLIEVMFENHKLFTASVDHKMRIDGKLDILSKCNYVDVIRLPHCDFLDGITRGRHIAALKIIGSRFVDPSPTWNISVDSPDNSYVLASGIDNFNSFVSFSGRAYWAFSEERNIGQVDYDPMQRIDFCFDFNVEPGIAVVVQEQWLNQVYSAQKVWGDGIIGEVYIPQNSNTLKVCDKLIDFFPDHKGDIYCYGDYTGGARGTASIMGTDWELIKRRLLDHYNYNQVHIKVKPNPRERDRINSVNSRCFSLSKKIRCIADPNKAPHTIRDFEGTRLIEGGTGEIDKRKDPTLSHMTDAYGYRVWIEHGLKKRYEPSGQKYYK